MPGHVFRGPLFLGSHAHHAASAHCAMDVHHAARSHHAACACHATCACRATAFLVTHRLWLQSSALSWIAPAQISLAVVILLLASPCWSDAQFLDFPCLMWHKAEIPF